VYRPWGQDPRPAWRVDLSWRMRVGDTGDGDLALLLRILRDTGHVSWSTANVVDGELRLTMHVRASGPEEAWRAGLRIGEVAYRAAGLSGLGENTLVLAGRAGSMA